MDITWAAIGKVMVAGLATYVLLPAVLIVRDYVLWRLINAYILNDSLRKAVRRYASLADHWNEKYAGTREFGSDHDEFLKDWESSEKAMREIQDVKLYIDRKSRFLTWLLRHYKQEQINPIGDWKKQAKEEVEKRKGRHKC